jgi:hypothetical protein
MFPRNADVMDVYDPDGYGGGGGGGDGGGKLPVYASVFEILRERFESGKIAQDRPHLVGLIIGRPSEPLVREQIIPSLEYWHHRSATYIDLFCVGFLSEVFDAGEFARTLTTFEQNTVWKYSGGTDLLLVNVKYVPDKRQVLAEYTNSLAVTLEAVTKIGGYERLPIFFEKIMAAAKESFGGESPSAVSDAFGKSLAKSALKGLLTSLLPDGVKQDARDAFLFAVRDISKREG